MIPWQIYCDYLEDKGIDCRIFRSLEPSVFNVSVFEGFPMSSMTEDSYGCGWGNGWYNGDGKGGGTDGFGGGWGDLSGGSYNNFISYDGSADKQTMVQ